jgi:hypothetical protein
VSKRKLRPNRPGVRIEGYVPQGPVATGHISTHLRTMMEAAGYHLRLHSSAPSGVSVPGETSSSGTDRPNGPIHSQQ